MIGFLMLAALPGTAGAGFQSGNDLLRDCEAQRPACVAYIEGALDMWVNGQTFGRSRKIVCLAPGVEAGQLRDIVIQWLNTHPEDRHLEASGLVIIAAAQAFPCS